MNDGRDEKFTIAQFSKILGFKKVGDLEDYFLNKKEPSLKFLRKFSNEFCLSLVWLTEGKKQPFKFDEETYIEVHDCLDRINEQNPYIIYFVRANDVVGKTCIVLEINDHRFIVLNRFIHFSNQVGYGGACDLASFRKLIMNLILDRKYITKSLIVSKRTFDDLYEGKIHFSTTLKLRRGEFQYWHDDFTDIYNERYGYRHHDSYDQNFKDAFCIAKKHIEEYGEP